jgi:hypothetical protein
MALANFFDKAALGAAQVLKVFDRENFEFILKQNIIGIVFDNVAAKSQEGRATLDLIVRLTARLYPDLQIIDISNENDKYQKELEECALLINPEINLSKSKKASINLIVGNTDYKGSKNAKFYVGSDGWVAKFSVIKPVGSGDSKNPFGAGAAACFGAANVFRMVFKDQLVKGDCDKDFSISIFDFIKRDEIIKNNGPNIDNIHLDETQLVGIGAIGNSFIWALANIPNLTGELEIIDNQTIDLSNLQRYSLASQHDVNKLKVTLAKEFMSNSKLIIKEKPFTWEEYMYERKDWLIRNIAVCVDSAKDRIIIQGSLPKKIFNAWTQPASLGVSRHLDFVNEACLTCLYMPDSKRKNLSEVIAESLGLKDQEPIIRKYIATKTPVDNMILSLVSNARGIPIDQLEPYLGKHMEIFYSEVVCGGILTRLNQKSEESAQVEVPSAFESALAGILLAAEIVIDAGNLRKKKIPTISKINLLRPLSNHLLEDQHKHHSSRCICQDPVFIKAYKKKWLNGLN